MSNSSNGTPTTSTPPEERPSPVQYPHHQSPPRQLWNSPFVPSKTSEWPDEKSKEYWIGPFDMYYNADAKKAREIDWKEDGAICNTRKLAESLYDVRDFAGARYAWAQIADQYISEHQHTSRWASDIDFEKAWDKRDALDHIAQASIGCILNAYLAQYPDLCVAIKANNNNCSSSHRQPHPVFTAVVDHEDNLTNSCTLYIMRVMLDFASDIAYGKNHSWMRTVYKRALDATGQITGLDLSETIRLRQGLVHEIVKSEREGYWDSINANRSDNWSKLSSEQREAHRTQSTQRWKDEVEELYMHIIADQQSLWGTTAEATIGSALELVNHYKSVGDIDEAKAKARQICTLTKDHLGEDHDSTFRCMASLSTLLLDTDSIEEAGLIVYDCLTRHPGIMSGSIDMLSVELQEKFTIKRGWKEIMMVRSKLENLMSPFHFVWADYRLYTLRIGTVTFAPSYLTDTEKDSVWALAYQEPKHKKDEKEGCSDDESSMVIHEDLGQQHRASPRRSADFEKTAFSASKRDHEFLDLQVPYIPYQYFMTTLAFETGMPYLEYVKAAEDWSISSYIHEEAATDTPIRLSEYLKQMDSWDGNSDAEDEDVETVEKQEHKEPSQPPDRARSKECVAVEFDEDPTADQIQGFFNNIPSEAYVSPELHVDLVSTQWADYQHFALHRLPDNATEIEIVEGLHLPCHGYISGTWTDFNVCQQRKFHEVFVVDASFLPAGVNGRMPMLALRQETVESSRYHEVTNAEKRAFCARLNPSFYRYNPVALGRPCAVYKRKMAKGTVTKTDELDLWDEMNAREKWDRDFETRKPTNDKDRAVLAQDLEAEDERRRVWDEEHQKKEKGEKESSSDLSTVGSGNVQIQSVVSGSSSEAGGRGLVGKFRKLRLRRTKATSDVR